MALFSGRSPQKTMVRSEAYIKGIPRKDFYTKKHILIASRECGDIHFLLAHGILKKNIIACDIDSVARRRAKKLGVIMSPHHDIRDTVQWAIAQYGADDIASINVDLCMNLFNGLSILQEVLDLSTGVADNTKIFFTFFRGRDGLYSNRFDDTVRKRFLQSRITWPIREWTEYQSFTATSVGSPMCLVQF